MQSKSWIRPRAPTRRRVPSNVQKTSDFTGPLSATRIQTYRPAFLAAHTLRSAQVGFHAFCVSSFRALEELEKHRAMLRELREDREGLGQGARAEAQKLMAENARLKKRQSELMLAFKKQMKLIDVVSAELSMGSPKRTFDHDHTMLFTVKTTKAAC